MAKSIQDLRSMTAPPQRAYEWEVSVVGLSTGNEEGLTVRAQSVSIPATSIEPIEINYKSRKTYYSGRDGSANTLTISFLDDEAFTAYNYFQQWADNLLSNPVTGGGTTRSLYTAEVLLKTLATDSTSVTSTTRLKNAFPTEIGDVALSYDTNEQITFDVTIQYDQKIFEPASTA